MSLPGLLVEYLITGAVGLLCIIFGFNLGNTIKGYENLSLTLIPIAYTLGMIIDLVAYGLTYKPKQILRNYVEKGHYGNKGNNFKDGKETKVNIKVNMLLITKHEKLNSEINMRSSRDRIARGMIVNALCVGLFFYDQIPSYIIVSFIIVSTLSWIIFEYLSHRFYLNAYDEVAKSIEP